MLKLGANFKKSRHSSLILNINEKTKWYRNAFKFQANKENSMEMGVHFIQINKQTTHLRV